MAKTTSRREIGDGSQSGALVDFSNVETGALVFASTPKEDEMTTQRNSIAMTDHIPTLYTLETERLCFSIPSKTDIPPIFEALHSEGFMDGMTWDAPETEKELEPSIDNIYIAWENGDAYTFSAYKKEGSDFVGRFGIYASDVERVWKIFYYVHPRCQNSGHATEGARKLLEFGFTDLNAQSIEAFHAAFNTASQRILEKIGMELIEYIPQSFQKHGKWVADNRFAITRETWVTQTTTQRRSVRAILLTPDNRILLIQSREPESGKTLWCPPGGGMEAGETPAESLLRELHEETGLTELPSAKHVWNRRANFRWAGERINQQEAYYLIRTPWFEPSMLNNPEETETDSFLGFRWWPVNSIEMADDLFIPGDLGKRLKDLLNGEHSNYPIEIN